jgi:hypothetical protein
MRTGSARKGPYDFRRISRRSRLDIAETDRWN